MTISSALKEWLSKYDGFELIDTDRLEATPESYGLYKQPTIEEIKYVDGTALRTEFYYFLARENSQLESYRKENHDVLESFERWIENQVEAGNVPKIKNFDEVGITNSFYLQEEDDEESIYQLGIYVTFLKEK